ncbi:SAV_2336 N-terminal domain-related protein [Streptomyces sp. NPDC060187]|uniref:SAV_2336 N-terminal domain-related protein n=1 Tax=Streptomyces sp. NPDC060187 TaxID=3347067 RepID=UPI0036568C20
MIEELFAALQESGTNAGPEELAEILWLAARIDGAHMHRSPQTGQGEDETAPAPAVESSSTASAAAAEPTSGEQFYNTTDTAAAPATTARSVDLVRIRRAASLHDPLAIMRALRPLGRHASPPPGDPALGELDEESTVRATIEQGLPLPVFHAHHGRWLDLALVVDTHHSMLLWHDLVTELRRVIIQTGIFRDVRSWYLSGTGADETPTVARAGGEPRSVQEVTDPSGHRLVLVLTDTVAGGWGTSGLQNTLRHWAAHSPVAVLNVLPRRLWDRGASQPRPHLVRAPKPAAPNASWRLGHPAGSRHRPRHRTALAENIAIPVIEASAASLATLADLVSGAGRWIHLTCLTVPRSSPAPMQTQPAPAGTTQVAPVSAAESLRRFRANASPDAQTLAGYLSAVPLNLPVMNLVRQIMLPQTDPGHLAEVTLGGLFEPWGHETRAGYADMDRVPFRFRTGIAEALLGSQLRTDITAVQELVRRVMGAHITEHGSGPAGDFLAARGTAGGNGSRTMGRDALPFADRTRMPSPVGRAVQEVLASYEGRPLSSLEREVDSRLGEAVQQAVNGLSSLVLLLGEPGSGMFGATARALQEIPDGWRVWSPDLSLTLMQGADRVTPQTVVLIEELQTYTAASDFPLEDMARILRGLLKNSERAPVLILGTLTNLAWDTLVSMAQEGPSGDYDNLSWLINHAEVVQASRVAHIGEPVLDHLGDGPGPDLLLPVPQDHLAAGPPPTAVILTALSLEYDAVRAHLTDVETLVGPRGTRAERGRLPGAPWYVALAQTGMGNAAAAALTERVITWLSPDALFLVGVAGGLKDDISIGDVVVATKVYDIREGKQTPEGFLVRPDAWRASHRLEQVARHALRRAEYRVHFKPIAVGDVVLASTDSAIARHIHEHYSDAAAIEMEAVGVAWAAHRASALDMLTIRGISDKGGTGKNAQHPSTAARHAASAAFAVLRELQPRDTPQRVPELPAEVLPDQDDVPSVAALLGSPERHPRWSGEPSQTRLVMIARTREPVLAGSKFDHLGTGFLLAPRLVLTAARILERDKPSWTVKVRNREGAVTADAWVDCRVLWRHDTYDAALLLAEHDLAEDATDSHFSTPRWAPPSSEPLRPCHITGVTVASSASSQVGGYLTGTLHPTSTHPDAPYDFEPATALPQFGSFARGISGAPVFFGEFLLGLVVARADRSRRPQLSVASIGTLASDPSFTEVCSQYMPRVPRLNVLPAFAPAGDSRTSGGRAAGLRPPRVFISYAHEDDNGVHAQQVRSLSQMLRDEGIDIRLDLVEAEVSQIWAGWIWQEIEAADVILVVASPAYKRQAEDTSSGVAYEARLLRNELVHASADRADRVLPVILPGSTHEDLPAFLRGISHFVIDPTTRAGAEQLLQRLVPIRQFFGSVSPQVRLTVRTVPAVLHARHALEVAHGLARALDSAIACNPAGIRDFEHEDRFDSILNVAVELTSDINVAVELAGSGLEFPFGLVRDLTRGQDLLDDVRHGLRHMNDSLSPTDRGEYMETIGALVETIASADQLARAFVATCTNHLQKAIGRVLRRSLPELDEDSLKTFLDDFTTADLTDTDLTGIDITQIRWSPSTRWPATGVEEVRNRSEEVSPGVYIVRSGTAGDG